MMRGNKKGFTLIEVLAASLILVIITIAVVFSLTFSQEMVQTNSNEDAYAAEVQTAADVIMSYVNGGITTAGGIQYLSRVNGEPMYIDASSGFNSEENKIQFEIEPTSEATSFYKITVRIYYGFTNERNSVDLVTYSHANW